VKKIPLRSQSQYDKVAQAEVYPWSHPFNTWVGFLYVYEDKDKQNLLVYFVPVEGGQSIHVHKTDTHVRKGVLVPISLPNPDEDDMIADISIL